ncbi:hypothetical protein KJ836_02100 [Patescibacteria group bacterium]|nr:hypothetical protein [Patescibacteria group bacterium]
MSLEKELDYYIKNQPEFLKEHEGKFLVIKNQNVIGIYDTEMDAYTKAQEENELGTFLIQKVEAGSEGYTQTYHSRVIFP